MRATTLVTGLLASSVLAGCHHRQTVEEQAPVVTSTTTTTTTTSTDPVASSSSNTSAPMATSTMPITAPRRGESDAEMRHDRRMERREVHLDALGDQGRIGVSDLRQIIPGRFSGTTKLGMTGDDDQRFDG